ncbi:MAG: hypothetical protein UT24_C0013G0015 [Candidatus Woesebacteria bacterium GW2011_GWB1_39_12]|uniref:ArnT-like N-terminal domain-containing protein n=2 Tax=Candidatus Woeseibacteriota TaxID=1752722 RepID=A0A0G0PH98_9BACT|nr:MAG: hypothetical protein UT23_C0012G0109 [Candidatus Woesebacteria bacterium GW2011_GWA1_39_12]KKR00349.1 MAG: hypothetical protein UT24_C0013G0015 [Candidatus Woesebacteria bacterium GW2011_GWB1_39_12]
MGAGIFVLALFLRLYNLTILPIFGDEAIYIRWAQVMRAEPGLRFIPLSDGKQPLFMWVVIPFLKIIHDPLVAARVVSVFTGIGSLIGVFVLTYILFNRSHSELVSESSESKDEKILNQVQDDKKKVQIALLASLIYAISPFTIFFDRMALADSMLAFFGVWTLVFSLLTARKIRLDTAILAGFCLGGAFLTKSPASFFAAIIPIALILTDWPKTFKKRFNRLSVYVFLFTFTYVIGFAIYNILRLGVNFQMIALRNKDYVFPITRMLQSPFDPLIPHLRDIVNYFWLMGPSVLVLLIGLGILVGWKLFRKETLILLAWGILPILAVAEFSKTMTARYIYFSLPYLFIVASLSLRVKLNHLRGEIGSHLEFLTKVLVALLALHALFIDFQLLTNPQKANLPRSERSGYLEEWTSGYGIKEVSEIIRQEYHQRPDQKIIVGTEGYFGTLPDGLQIYLNNAPEITVIGVGIEIEELPKSLAESRDAGNKTYLVINNSRLLADPEDLDLNLIAVYPKAFRKAGTREYNTLGPRESLYLFEVMGESIEFQE